MNLLPSLKQKKRYVVFEIISADKSTEKSAEKFSDSEIKAAVEEALLLFLGQLGLSKAVPLLVKSKNNKFIIKASHNWVDEVKAALILIKKIKNQPIIVKSIITSGTINKASTCL
ncbi:MAG TPA: Rpp14/Pop5 family protein [Candidatus Nanoarchaeia archaeon]|nr:Rpp14/Pop5 family protein [Candidatus Nanoarchaeia archaeon]